MAVAQALRTRKTAPKSIGTTAQMANGAKELEGVAFLLQGIGFAVGFAKDFEAAGL